MRGDAHSRESRSPTSSAVALGGGQTRSRSTSAPRVLAGGRWRAPNRLLCSVWERRSERGLALSAHGFQLTGLRALPASWRSPTTGRFSPDRAVHDPLALEPDAVVPSSSRPSGCDRQMVDRIRVVKNEVVPRCLLAAARRADKRRRRSRDVSSARLPAGAHGSVSHPKPTGGPSSFHSQGRRDALEPRLTQWPRGRHSRAHEAQVWRPARRSGPPGSRPDPCQGYNTRCSMLPTRRPAYVAARHAHSFRPCERKRK